MKLFLAIFAVISPLCAQVNFHGSIEIDGARSKPAQSGTALPGTCVVGDQFFKTDATAGQNLYGCTATNTWTQQAGGGGSTTTGSMLPQVTGTLPGTTVTVGAVCTTQACGGTFGATTRTWSTAPTIQITAATGSTTVRIWMASSGNVIFNYDNTVITAVTLGSGISGDTASVAFPSDVLPIASCATTGVNFTSCADLRFPKTNTLAAGTGPATVTPTATGFQVACPTCFDNSSFNDITQAAAPSAPSAGSVRVYGKTATGTLCSKDSTNTETCYGAGGGGSPIMTTANIGQYIPWTGYSDGSSATFKVTGANQTIFFAHLLPAQMKVGGIVARQFTDDPAKHFAWALYDSTCTLIASTTTSTSASGSFTYPFAAQQTVGPGPIYIAYTSDSTTITFFHWFNATQMNDYLNDGRSAGNYVVFTGTASTGTSTLVFPGTCGTRTKVNGKDVPIIALVP
jgi:hypothetical protein